MKSRFHWRDSPWVAQDLETRHRLLGVAEPRCDGTCASQIIAWREKPYWIEFHKERLIENITFIYKYRFMFFFPISVEGSTKRFVRG